MAGVTKMQQIRSANALSSIATDCCCQLLQDWYCLQAAVDMMRKVLNTVNMDGVIVIGEGEKDEVNVLLCIFVGVIGMCVVVRGSLPQYHTQTLRLCCLQAPMLYCGEQIGNGTLEPQVDIAVDPLDGTTSIALVYISTSNFHILGLTLEQTLVKHTCCAEIRLPVCSYVSGQSPASEAAVCRVAMGRCV